MPNNPGLKIGARLYDATYYQGHAIAVRPDGWDRGEGVVVYSLAYLGLRRLGSLQAPLEAAASDNPFRQAIGCVTHVTVWAYRPDTWPDHLDEHGTTWQQYSADTADLGTWAARTKYVRVWQQANDGVLDLDRLTEDSFRAPITIME
ncbi:hypothetical protein OG523_01715 [Streptomyces virginiae]|uniref:hypothetical protein n=1 Tax=Streptomyces virginiae TaxID=1961 RepID=UPI002E32B1A7|nr:hypothetical protein [Streptomyces virginiae]